jgi:polysaccharide biosynthesis transport protein
LNIIPQQLGQTARFSSLSPDLNRAPKNEIDVAIAELFQAIKNHPFTIILVLLSSLALALVYLTARQPIYQSTATLLIDPARPNILASQQVTELTTVDSGVVDSAVEIIGSDFIAQTVTKNLNLTSDPEFTEESGIRKLVRPLQNMIKSSRPLSPAQIEQSVSVAIQKQLDVRRIGLTYVVEVSAKSLDPEKSAKLANSFIDAYLENEIDVKLDMAKRASSWLDGRTNELRDRVVEADKAVQSYRTANDLVDTKATLPLDQQLAELTSKISQSRGKETTARVLADHIRTLIEQKDFDSAAIAAPPESSVRKIRNTVVELAGREKDLSARVGRQHRLTLDARADTEAARVQLRDEVLKYQASLSSEVQSANAEVTQLDAELKALTVGQLAVGNKSIQLRELERNADAARLLYETFLIRLKEIRQQETMPVQDARVIASAVPPLNPSNMSAVLILGCAMGIGLLGGVLMALLRDRFDPTIRSERDAEVATGLRVLATLDEITSAKSRLKTSTANLKLIGRAAQARGAAKSSVSQLLTYAIDAPFSSFAENLRHLRLVLNRHSGSGGKIVGVITASSGEGKTTVACNLAHLYAASGARTILVDCDLRNPKLSEQLCPSEKRGLPDVLLGDLAWRDAVKFDSETKLSLLTGTSLIAFGNPSELLTQPVFDELLEKISQSYDVVILDLAPIGPVTDALVVAHLVDFFVLVVASSQASKDGLRQILDHAPDIYEKTIGVVLNRVQYKGHRKTYPALNERTAYSAAA